MSNSPIFARRFYGCVKHHHLVESFSALGIPFCGECRKCMKNISYETYHVLYLLENYIWDKHEDNIWSFVMRNF